MNELKWQLMYEGPALGHFLGQQVFIDPFSEEESLLNTFTGFEYEYYLWYSDSQEAGGIHGGYYVKSDLERATERGKVLFFDEDWLARWYRAIDDDSEKVERLMSTYRLENMLDTLAKETVIELIPKIIDLELRLLSFVRCSQPQLTDALKNRLFDLLRDKVDAFDLEQVFVDLTLPEERSLFTDEEIAWLDIVIDAESAIKSSDVTRLTTDLLADQYGEIWQRVQDHHKKYSLIPASDRTPAWKIGHFVDLLKASLSSGSDHREKRTHISEQYKNVLATKRAIVEKYALPDEALILGTRIAKVGFYRFKASFFWRWMGYYLVLICERYAQDLGLSYREMSSMTKEELLSALKGTMTVPKEELSHRSDAELYLRANGRNYLWWGEEARQKKFELLGAVDYGSITELRGEVGSTGFVRGIAFVFQWSDDVAKKMYDMPKGSILVAPQTHPTYMPAIRLASALVCDEGGVTGHAAIVSRELHKPCVIGLHIGTKVIHTGDEIEVDANKGIVRIIRRASERGDILSL